MKNRIKTFTIFCLLIFGIANAQEDGFPIEQKLYDCMNSIQPFEIEKAIPCIQKATTDCELEMKKTYEKLLELVDDKNILTDSQNEWKKYRDAQIELMNSFLNKKPDKWKVERRLINFELTKNRLFELENLIRIYNY
ncbi:lysozyme inhibitor LprI family protein [Winogradskyella sp. HB-48]|uniref:lysozyme inhibitor LprI family protein n=1 Tax=Winogradskyella sp. HB-48 TaxID=3416808 RepID=UPI003CED8FBB